MSNAETKYAISIWQKIMAQYLENKEPLKFTYDENVISATFCQQSGKLANATCPKTGTGWYKKDELPDRCDLAHETEGEGTSSAGEEGPTPEVETPSDPTTSSQQASEHPMESNASSENTSVPETPPSQPEVPSQEPEENPDDNIVVVPGEQDLPPGIVPVG